MSRKMLIVAVVVAVLLVTFVVPAMAAPPEAHDGVAVQTEVWSAPSTSPSVLPLPIRLDGDCEGGGTSGCPNPG
jgi:hypothetical protein